MANIKNFGIVGIGSDVQFGKGGARIIQANGLFQVKTANATALANLQVAAPTANDDATTKLYVDTANAAVTAALAAETAARIADVNDEETRAKAAEDKLTGDLAAEVTRATAAEGTLTTNLAAEVTRATAAEGTLTTDLAAEVATRTANVASLTAAISAEATARQNADTALQSAISALGSAFNYVGTVEGGADAESATDLNLQVAGKKDPGDYYKVATAGHFKVTVGEETTTFYANVNDGLVWNLDGGVDKIDNTNSVVSGVANFVTVTGSTDTGFTVDVATAFKNRVSTLESGLTTEIADRAAAVAAEANARTAADTLLTTNLAKEVQDRIDAVAAEAAARTQAVSDEANARTDADTLLGGRIDTEISDRQAAVSNEANARTAADTALGGRIDQEISDRANAVTTLQSSVSSEAAARLAKDNALQAELDATQLGAGLGTDGTYTAPTSSTYLGAATSLADADSKLDAAVKAEVDRATAAELVLTGNIAAEAARATAAEGVLTANVAAEVARATAAEGVLTTALSTETTARQTADTALQGAIDAEAAARAAADTALTNNLAAEVTRATDAEGVLDGKIGTEKARAEAAETTLDGKITAEKNRAEAAEQALTASIAALGSAFNYVGVLDGGADAANALDMSALDETDTGDYYKVANSGYFTFGETTFHANANDGLIFNGVGGVDIIDNTNSVVRGTTDFVTVTGSTEFGFDVTIADTFKTRVSTLETGLSSEITRATGAESSLQSNIAAEAATRLASDNALQANIAAEAATARAAEQTLTTDLAAEVTRAEAAEGVLTTNLSNEVDRATAAEGVLTTNLSNEVTRAQNAEAQLTSDLAAEVTRAKAAEAAGNTAVVAETTRATNAEAALQTELDATQTGAGLGADGAYTAKSDANYIGAAVSLKDADNKLDAALKVEELARIAADAALQSELDATQAGAGLAADGSYVANATGNYISTATSLAVADDLLDTALKAEVTRATGAESTLTTNLAAEVTRATGAEATLTTNLAAEVTRATAAEGTLTTNLAAEVSRATTAEGVLDGKIATEKTRAEGVEADLSAAIDAEETRAKAAELALDGKIAALGSAFNYVGTVAGGADEANAFDMTTKTETDAGDYYKVTTAGWFKVGEEGTPFYANANDGLVFNLADGVDKIDNTDSTVAGTPNFIAVSGSVDTGYTVDVDTAFKGRVSTLESGLAQELLDRAAADTTLDGKITAEKNRAETAEGVLDGKIAAEKTRAEAAEATLTTNLATEVTNRTNADAALQSELDATQTGAGLAANGAYVANATGNYIAAATSLAVADDKLDAAIKKVATDLAELSQDEIRNTANTVSVRAANSGIQFSANVDGDKTLVGEIVAGVDTNTIFQIDMATADEVRIEADGTSDDVDIRLVPKGDGQVYIGDVGDGVIQAEDGFSLTLAGGDNASGAGGSLILKGGDGTTDGIVDVQDGSGASVAKFSGSAGATAFTGFVNGTSSVSMVADGTADDISIVLDPKGTGTVDVSSARVVNVAAPTAGTDAANKAYVDTNLAGGYVKTAVVDITESTGAVSLGSIKGTVLRVKVYVTTAFSTGASITVGTAADSTALAPSSNVDETATGLYLVETMSSYGSTTELVAAVTAGSGSTGTGKVVIEYLTA